MNKSLSANMKGSSIAYSAKGEKTNPFSPGRLVFVANYLIFKFLALVTSYMAV